MLSGRLFETYNTKFDFEFHIWTDKISTMHGHDFYEFALCDSGEITYRKNNETTRTIKTKQAVFVTPADSHSLVACKDKVTRHINLSVKKEAFLKICEYHEIDVKNFEIFNSDCVTLEDTEFSYFGNLLDKVLRLDENKEEKLYVATLRQMVDCLFYAFLRNAKKQDSIPVWLQQFAEKVSSPESFEYRLYDLYNLCNYSQPVVTNCFKKYYNTTLIDYFTRAKIAYSCKLLKNTNVGLLEISNRLGFTSLSHFNHAFKKIMHVTPSKYRKD